MKRGLALPLLVAAMASGALHCKGDRHPPEIVVDAPPPQDGEASPGAASPASVAPRGTRPGHAFAAGGGAVLFWAPAEVALMTANERQPSVRRALPKEMRSAVTQPGESPVLGDLVQATRGLNLVVALDRSTLADRWSFDPGADVWAMGAARTDDTVVLRLRDRNASSSAHDAVVALDTANGAVRWRHAGETGHVWAGGGRVFVSTAVGALEALDAGTGASSWKVPRRFVQRLAASTDRLATFNGDDVIRVLDAATGRELAALREGHPDWDSEVAVADGVVYVVVHGVRGKLLPGQVGGRETTVLAIDMGAGKLVWKTPATAEIVASRDGTGGLAVTDREVLACTNDGALRSFDRSTGSPTSVYGLGHCHPIVASAGARGVTLFTENGDDTEVIEPERGPSEAVTVSGVVRLNGEPLAGARVVALGAATKTDAGGRYTLSLQATGRVLVQARGEGQASEKCDALAQGSAAPLELSGLRAHSVDVAVEQNCTCGL